jgi:hypothetical protein
LRPRKPVAALPNPEWRQISSHSTSSLEQDGSRPGVPGGVPGPCKASGAICPWRQKLEPFNCSRAASDSTKKLRGFLPEILLRATSHGARETSAGRTLRSDGPLRAWRIELLQAAGLFLIIVDMPSRSVDAFELFQLVRRSRGSSLSSSISVRRIAIQVGITAPRLLPTFLPHTST